MSSRIDVKNTGGPYNLGASSRWSEEDKDFLISHGAYLSETNYILVPLTHISGEVSLGIGKKGLPPSLEVGGCKLNTGRKPFVIKN